MKTSLGKRAPFWEMTLDSTKTLFSLFGVDSVVGDMDGGSAQRTVVCDSTPAVVWYQPRGQGVTGTSKKYIFFLFS